MKQVSSLDPATYQPHLIHQAGRCWAETNCYVDVLVELLHGLGFEPIAALPFTLRIDFEGDQWTFFKFPHADLQTLYGLDIQELNPWRSLAQHVEQQVIQGRPVLIELDSYYLPDTRGTAYRQTHEKTTVAVNAIDIKNRRLGYFHGQSYYHLEGQDFVDIFQLEGLAHERILPPYIEYVKLQQNGRAVGAEELTAASLEILKYHLALIPKVNPFTIFKQRFMTDLEWLMQEPIETFHAYSFATLRQYGACFELAETYIQWLQQRGETGLSESEQAFSKISSTAKVLQFQLARAVARKKPLELTTIDDMATYWHNGTQLLVNKYL